VKAHAWYVGLTVAAVDAKGRFVPRCECGWSAPSVSSERAAAEQALDHVRTARKVAK